MFKVIKYGLMNEKLNIRIISCLVIFLITFNLFVVLSYFLLPQGFLLSKNSILDWETSDNLLVVSVQLFAFNLLSVIAFIIGNFFAFPSRKNPFISMGFYLLFIQYTLNATTLGTWSFTAVNYVEPKLINRILRTFNLTRAGIWEMVGQLLITAATARIAVLKQNNKDVYNCRLKKRLLSLSEIITIIVGLCLMLMGAYIESQYIVS